MKEEEVRDSWHIAKGEASLLMCRSRNAQENLHIMPPCPGWKMLIMLSFIE
jgi:hypothetical protein